MLNRRHIRTKVMQALYANKGNKSEHFAKDEIFLMHSLDGMYDLYLSILALLLELQKKSKNYNEKLQQKLLSSDSDKNPNTQFQDNQLLHLIGENKMLRNMINQRKLNFWDLDFEYVDLLFKTILKSTIYKDYVNSSETSFASDKQFIIDIYADIIAPNDKLYAYLEDKKLTWMDDFPVVNTVLLKTLRKLKRSAPETSLLPDLYKDESDKDFAKALLEKTILNNANFEEEIAAKTTNWDSERLASIDGVLLKMALCEFQKFPSIPYKVTINEYLEIAKEYSTPKSSLFINGILDKIVKEYQSQKLHPKTGRGLI